MKLTLIRYTKIVFCWLRLHRLFGAFYSVYLNIYYLSKLSAFIAASKKVTYNDFPSKWSYNKRFTMYEEVITLQQLTSPINYLEFGVADGHSFQWFMKMNQHPESRFNGFDTFEGLPEDYGVMKKGTFANADNMPLIPDERGKFHKGLFQQTLPSFLKNFDNSKRNVVMMDADLYTATLYVLTSLAPFLKKDDIVFFDEFAVPTHEF